MLFLFDRGGVVYDRGSQMGVRGPLGIPEVLINGDFFFACIFISTKYNLKLFIFINISSNFF